MVTSTAAEQGLSVVGDAISPTENADIRAFPPSRGHLLTLVRRDSSRGAVRPLDSFAPCQRAARPRESRLGLAIRRGLNLCSLARFSFPTESLAGLESLVSATTGEENPLLDFLTRRTGQAPTITLQAKRPDGEILGHLKVPLNDAAAERIRHEAATLSELNRHHALRAHIPRVLYSGAWQGQNLLFLSARAGVAGPDRFNGMHVRFLQNLRRARQVRRSGAALAEEVAADWNAASGGLSPDWRKLGRDALRLARRELGGAEIACGLSHGDFAPWNTHVYEGHLFVFDWESAEWDMPLWWDLFHFDLQVESLLRQKSGIEIERVEAPAWNGLYLLYLMHSVLRSMKDGAGEAALESRRNKLVSRSARYLSLRPSQR